jgi:hypothetical protein
LPVNDIAFAGGADGAGGGEKGDRFEEGGFAAGVRAVESQTGGIDGEVEAMVETKFFELEAAEMHQ